MGRLASAPMANIVLIPGAWFGADMWGEVPQRLSADHGHTVRALTLPGLAERADEKAAEVTLADHVSDVLDALAAGDLHDLVLVGHCYAGSVAAQVAVAAPERVAHLVLLDANVPSPGAGLLEHVGVARPAVDELIVRQAAERIAEHGGLWAKPEPGDLARHGLTDEQVGWLLARASDQPGRTILDPAVLAAPLDTVRTTYINCTLPRAEPHPSAAPYTDAESWHFVDFDAGHYPMISHPVQLASLLDELAALADQEDRG